MFKFSYAAKVGLMFIVGVFLFFMALEVMGFKIWSPKTTKGYNIAIVFETAKGLQEGHEVQLNGRYVGEVETFRTHQFGEVEVPVRIFKDEYKIHRNAFFTISRESIFGSYILYISEVKGGFLKSRGTDGNVITLEMPRGETVRGADVVYHPPSAAVPGVKAPGTLIGTVLDIVKNPDRAYSDNVTVMLLPDIEVELTEHHTFVASHQREERLIPTAGSYVPEEVITGQIDVYERLRDGDVVIGFREPGPEDLVASADKLVQSASEAIEKVTEGLTEVVSNINVVLSELGNELTGEGEGTIKAELIDAIESLRDSLGNIENLTDNLNGLITDSKPRIDNILAGIEGASENVESVTAEIHDLVSDPELLESIKNAVDNLDKATEEVLKIMEEIEELVGDEELKSDIKGLIGGAKETIEKASNTLDAAQEAIDTVSETEFGGEFRLRYLPEPETFASDVEFTIKPAKGDLFYRIGLDDVGRSDDFSFQLGLPSKRGWAGRFGLKRGAIGAGIDYKDGRFILRGDLYNLNDVHFDIYGGYALSDDLRFIIGFEDLYDEDLFHFGIATEF